MIRRIGRRGAALAFFALVDYVFAWTMIAAPSPDRPSARWIASIMPPWCWAAVWLTVGVVVTVGVFRICDREAFAAAIGVKVLWATVHLVGWVAGQNPLGWVTAVVFYAFAAFVWLIAGWPEDREGPTWTPRSRSS